MSNKFAEEVKPPKDKKGMGDSGKTQYPKRIIKKLNVLKQQNFQGKCDELNGHIYDCTDSRQSDMFTKTTKEIGEYVGTNYRHGNDTKIAIITLTMLTFEDPPIPLPTHRKQLYANGKNESTS